MNTTVKETETTNTRGRAGGRPLVPWSRLLVVLGACLALATAAGAAEPKRGGTYRSHAAQDPRSLDPHMETSGATTFFTNQFYNSLLRLNEDMSGVELDLAESWRQIDEVTYEFKIHKGVKFHKIPPVNGRELTSEDVKYSIERIAGMHGKAANFKHRYYYEDKLASIETPDRYTVIVKTKEPYAAFINYIAAPWSVIVPKEADAAFGDLKMKAIGTGPFQLEEHVRGSHISMVRNPEYFKKGLPYLDRIHIKIMPDPASVLAAFLARDLDVMGAYFFQIDTLKEKAPDASITRRGATHMWVLRCPPWIEGQKPLPPPFDKRAVRQAIAMSIDKDRLLKLAWGGAGEVQVGPVPNFPPWSLPKSDQVEYNPAKAKKLLTDAGYPNGFSAELLTWNLPYMTKPAQVIMEMLKGVGITLELKTLEFGQYFNRAYKFDYQMALHIMTAATDPEEMLLPYYGPLKTSTFYKWSNPEIWKLITEQSTLLDKRKRIAKIHEIQRKVLDDAPNVFLYTQDRFLVERPYMKRSKLYYNEFQVGLEMETRWIDK